MSGRTLYQRLFEYWGRDQSQVAGFLRCCHAPSRYHEDALSCKLLLEIETHLMHD